jgi:hypothetical protein
MQRAASGNSFMTDITTILCASALLGVIGAILFWCILQGNRLPRQWRRCSECRRWFTRDSGEYGDPAPGDLLNVHLCWCPECQSKAANKFNDTMV